MIKSSHLLWFGFLVYLLVCIFGSKYSGLQFYWGFWNVPINKFNKLSYYILYIISQMFVLLAFFIYGINFIGEKLSVH
jgi:hypothetical protein